MPPIVSRLRPDAAGAIEMILPLMSITMTHDASSALYRLNATYPPLASWPTRPSIAVGSNSITMRAGK